MTTCPYVCNNKTEFGYCCSTVCINPKYNQRTINGGLTADYVQVVRCKDCKYYEQTDDDYEGEQGEDSWGVCSNTGAGMMRCGYCSCGERKYDE